MNRKTLSLAATKAVAAALVVGFATSAIAAPAIVDDTEHGPVPAAAIVIDYDSAREYPRGTLAMSFRVDAGGSVDPASLSVDRKATSAPDDIVQLTMAAARSWRFAPAVHDGKAVPSEVSYRIVYEDGVTKPKTVDATYRLANDEDASAKFAVGRRTRIASETDPRARIDAYPRTRSSIAIEPGTSRVFRGN